MKTKLVSLESGFAASKRRDAGSITLVFIALLAIMMILVMAESRALIHLRREVKFLEQQQMKRLNPPPTNAVAAAVFNGK